MSNLLELIKERTSSDSAINSKELSSLLNCKGGEIREGVNKLRRLGEPICSCRKGYYYSRDYVEIAKTIEGLESRVNSMFMAIEGLFTALPINDEEDI